MLVENCSFAWNAIEGFNFHPWSTGVKGALPSNCVARGNISEGNGSNGMSAGEAEGLLLKGNTFSWNNVRRFKRSWGVAGAKVIQSHSFVAGATCSRVTSPRACGWTST